eukprot:jgi/Chlat1/9080/Chrsp96S08372
MMNWGSGGAGGGGAGGGGGGGGGGGFGRADGGSGGLPFRRVRSELNLDQITALGGGGGVGIGAGLAVVDFSAHHHQHHQHHLAAAHGRVPAAGMAAAAHVPAASSSSASAMDASSPLGGGWRNDASDVLLPDIRVKQEPPMWVPVGAGGALQRAGPSGGGGGHRRSASDSYNFVDDAFADEFGDAPGPSHAQVGVGMGSMGVGVGQLPSTSRMGVGDPHYDKLDDEQLLSMFMDVDTLDSIALPTETPNRAALGVPPGSSAQQQQQRPMKTAAARRPILPSNGIAANAVPIPSCPEENLSDGSDGSDPNSTSEEGSLARMYASDPALLAAATSSGKAQDPNLLDPKRAKRILANRQSAQRSRMRKLQYISELEKRVAALQNDVANIAPQVQYLTNKRMGLDAENQELKARLTQIAQATRYKDALNEALREDLQRLKANYGRMASAGQLPASAPAGSEFINSSPARQQTAMEMAQAS